MCLHAVHTLLCQDRGLYCFLYRHSGSDTLLGRVEAGISMKFSPCSVCFLSILTSLCLCGFGLERPVGVGVGGVWFISMEAKRRTLLIGLTSVCSPGRQDDSYWGSSHVLCKTYMGVEHWNNAMKYGRLSILTLLYFLYTVCIYETELQVRLYQ